MPDLQEPSRVLIGGMQTDEGLAAIQELVSPTFFFLFAVRVCFVRFGGGGGGVSKDEIGQQGKANGFVLVDHRSVNR